MSKENRKRLQELGRTIVQLSGSAILLDEDAADIIADIESALSLAYYTGALVEASS